MPRYSNRGPKKVTLSFESSATVRLDYRDDSYDSGTNDFELSWSDAWGLELDRQVRQDVNKQLAKLGIRSFLL
jgi:hypothetical protein